VTFRLPDERAGTFALRSVFARTWGYSLGKVGGAADRALASDCLAARRRAAAGSGRSGTCTFGRAIGLARDEGYDGAADALAAHARRAARRARAGSSRASTVNSVATDGRSFVLDCVLGRARRNGGSAGIARRRRRRAGPAALPTIALPGRAWISRAYLKIVEALEWSELPIAAAIAASRSAARRAGRASRCSSAVST
jgi:hypothetical protein